MRSPIRWAGGKSRLRSTIIDIIPEHSCYVEPFCGAAWVLFGKQPSPVEVLNDIDGELVNFFQVIKSSPEEFINSFELTLVSRQVFDELANTSPDKLDSVARAHRFYYIIMAGWGGELNYPRFQTSISDGGHGNRLIGAIKSLRSRIDPIHKRLSTVIIENLDWRECISRYDRSGVVLYIDPPYPGNGVNYAHNMRSWADHTELCTRLKSSTCKWIVSSYDLPEVREMYKGHNVFSVLSSSGMRVTKHDSSRVVVKEVLITNFDVAKFHDTLPLFG